MAAIQFRLELSLPLLPPLESHLLGVVVPGGQPSGDGKSQCQCHMADDLYLASKLTLLLLRWESEGRIDR